MGSEKSQCNQFYVSNEQANQITYYHHQQAPQQQQQQQQSEVREKGGSLQQQQQPQQWQEQQNGAGDGRWQGNPYHRFYEANYGMVMGSENRSSQASQIGSASGQPPLHSQQQQPPPPPPQYPTKRIYYQGQLNLALDLMTFR